MHALLFSPLVRIVIGLGLAVATYFLLIPAGVNRRKPGSSSVGIVEQSFSSHWHT